MPGNYLYINQLDKVDWEQASKKAYAEVNSVAVWRIAVADLIPALQNLQALLLPEEIEKIVRYKQEKDRNHQLISKAVLRILFGRYTGTDPKEIKFELDKNKKPCLASAFSDALQFNVSHSGSWVLITIATVPVGIDVEQVNASFTYQNLLSFTFNPQEVNYIEQSERPRESFYQLWTRKECLLKATGKGLVDDLAAIPCLNGVHQNPETITGSNQSWQITSFNVDENHVASAAFYPVKTALRLFNFQL